MNGVVAAVVIVLIAVGGVTAMVATFSSCSAIERTQWGNRHELPAPTQAKSTQLAVLSWPMGVGGLRHHLPHGRNRPFWLTIAMIVASGVLSILWIGLPLLVAAAVVIRGFAQFERFRLGIVQSGFEPSPYRAVNGEGLYANLKQRWADPATVRSLIY